MLQETLLGDIRVLDLADDVGAYTSQLLAELGADVIKVEPPGGDPSRGMGPFVHDIPGPERSLHFFALNRSKRGITLNLDTADGRALLKRLVEGADVLVESFPPGHMAKMGLGYDVLKEINQGLIFCSVSGFGQSGPFRDFKAPDIVVVAMGGLMYLGGFPDAAPYRTYGYQSHYMGSLHGAAGISIALFERDVSGEGQAIDISRQECTTIAMETAMQFYDLRKEIRKRWGFGGTPVGGLGIRVPGRDVYQCKDGYMLWLLLIDWENVVKWMDSKGMAEDLMNEEWQDFIKSVGDRTAMMSLIGTDAFLERMMRMEHLDQVFKRFLAAHPVAELYEEGQRQHFICAPVSDPAGLVNDPHLNDRDYFVEVDHPELGVTMKYAGPPYRLSETPWQVKGRPPLVGEHNLDVYHKELGLSRQELELLTSRGII